MGWKTEGRAAAAVWIVVVCGCAAPETGAVPAGPAVQGSAGTDGAQARGLGCEMNAPTAKARATIAAELHRIRALGERSSIDDPHAVTSELDAAWKRLADDRAAAVTVLREQLSAELDRDSPNGFFLADAALFLLASTTCEGDVEIASRAILAVDPSQPAVRSGHQTVFHLAYGLAKRGRADILPALDRLILVGDAVVQVPQHGMMLDVTLQAVFVYGAIGPSTEAHLAALLSQPDVPHMRIVEVLNWLGTEASVEEALRVLQARPTEPMAKRVVGFMMRVGGLSGRRTVLSLDTTPLTPRAKAYVQGIRAQIGQDNPDVLSKQIRSAFGPGPSASDAEVRAGLERMAARNGVDDSVHPMAVIESSVPNEELIRRLVYLRSRTLHRLSDEALADVQLTNLVLNAVQYRSALDTRQDNRDR